MICLLSGWAGQTHYHTMHEVVGTAWWSARRRLVAMASCVTAQGRQCEVLGLIDGG